MEQAIQKFQSVSYLLASQMDGIESHEIDSLLNERQAALDEIQNSVESGIPLTLQQRQELSQAEMALTTKMNAIRSDLRSEYDKQSRAKVGRQAYGSGSTQTYELTG